MPIEQLSEALLFTASTYTPPPGRHSSAVEQLFRKQQVLGSNPSVGSSPLRVKHAYDGSADHHWEGD